MQKKRLQKNFFCKIFAKFIAKKRFAKKKIFFYCKNISYKISLIGKFQNLFFFSRIRISLVSNRKANQVDIRFLVYPIYAKQTIFHLHIQKFANEFSAYFRFLHIIDIWEKNMQNS